MTIKWILFAYVLMITGCAINNKGLTQLQYFENETSYLSTQKTWGGYISTDHADRGLTLGHSERVKIYPKLTKEKELPIRELIQQVESSDYLEVSASEIDLGDIQPFAWVEKNQGVMFHANPTKVGFSVGVESRSVLRLPPEFDGIFMFHRYEDGNIKAGAQGSLLKEIISE